MAKRGGTNPHRKLRLERLSRESDVLRTWGEIAAVLQVSERTAMLYQQQYALPVFKPPGAPNQAVVGSRKQILGWLAEHYQTLPGAEGTSTSHEKLVRLHKAAHAVLGRLEAARRAVGDGKAPMTPMLLATLAAADDDLRKALAAYAP